MNRYKKFNDFLNEGNSTTWTDKNTGKSYDIQKSGNKWEMDIMKPNSGVYTKNSIVTIKRSSPAELKDWLDGYKIDSSWMSHLVESVNESLNINHISPGRKKVNIIVGRFQPPTLGHLKVIESLSKANGLPVVILLVDSRKLDEKSPFQTETILQIFEELVKKHKYIEDVRTIKSASIDGIFNVLRPEYEPILWGTGTDRLKSYNVQVQNEKYRTALNVDPEFKTYEILRGDEDISASKVRNAIKSDDIKLFKSMVDPILISYLPVLKSQLEDK